MVCHCADFGSCCSRCGQVYSQWWYFNGFVFTRLLANLFYDNYAFFGKRYGKGITRKNDSFSCRNSFTVAFYML